MKLITLTKGMFAKVDDDDCARISERSWRARKDHHVWYAHSDGLVGEEKTIYLMHREVMRARAGILIDHINHDGLDNQKSNLRFCSHPQNAGNSKGKIAGRFTSRYIGVYWDKKASKWVANIHVDKKAVYLGAFDDEQNAALAYNHAAKRHFGEIVTLNQFTTSGEK